MKKSFLSLSVLCALMASPEASAQSRPPRLAEDQFSVTYPGIMPYYGYTANDAGRHEGGVAFGTSTHQRGSLYGIDSLRIQIGNTFGINFAHTGGVNVLPSNGYFVLGLEPINIDGNAVLQDGGVPRNYIQWLPMAAAGLQVPAGTCRMMAVIRGGASLSTLNGVNGAYGLGGYINCDQVVDIAAHLTRMTDSEHPVDIAMVEVQLPVIQNNGGQVSLGLRGEYLNVHNGSAQLFFEMPDASESPEHRIFLVVSSAQSL